MISEKITRLKFLAFKGFFWFALLSVHTKGFCQYASDKSDTRHIPSFIATTLNGSKIYSDSLRSTVVLLNFYYIGCFPCMKEIAALNEIYTEFKDDNFLLLAVAPHNKKSILEFNNLKKPSKNVKGFKKALNIPKMDYTLAYECENDIPLFKKTGRREYRGSRPPM